MTSIHYDGADGEKQDYAVQGMLIYLPNGDMSVVWMCPGRRKFASNDKLRGTPEELQEAVSYFDAYCGTYTVDEERACVTHHVAASLFPNHEGADQVRHYRLSGDELTLITDPLYFAQK